MNPRFMDIEGPFGTIVILLEIDRIRDRIPCVRFLHYPPLEIKNHSFPRNESTPFCCYASLTMHKIARQVSIDRCGSVLPFIHPTLGLSASKVITI